MDCCSSAMHFLTALLPVWHEQGCAVQMQGSTAMRQLKGESCLSVPHSVTAGWIDPKPEARHGDITRLVLA